MPIKKKSMMNVIALQAFSSFFVKRNLPGYNYFYATKTFFCYNVV